MAQTAEIKITADTSQAERALGGLNNTLKTLAAVVIGGNVVASLGKMAIEAQEITNKLISVSSSLDEANGKFYMIGQTAMKTGSSIGGTADLYQKLAMSATFAGSGTEALLKITENFNKSLQISGASGASAASALYQFAQAAQKGTLNGDEFRTMAETNGYMLQLLSKELKISQTELRQMASDGKLSMEIIGRALMNSEQLAKDYGKTIKTIPQAMENLKTSVMMSVKALDDATGASAAFARAIMLLADNIPIVVAVLAGLAAAFVVINFGAIIVGVRALTVAMVGLAASMGPIGLGITAIAGVAAYLGMNKAIDDAKNKTEQLNEAGKKGLVVTHQRTQEALDLDKALKEQIANMNIVGGIEMRSTGMKSLQLEVEKALALEKQKYVKTGESMTAQQIKEFTAAERLKILAQEHVAIQQQMVGLKSQFNTLGIVDVDQQRIAQQMEQFRLSVTNETYQTEKARLENQLRLNQAKEIETTYARIGAAPAPSEVAQGAASAFGGTQEGILATARNQQIYLDALKEKGKISTQSYADQEVLINRAKTDAILAQEQSVANARLQLAGVTNQAIIDSVKAQMANVQMIQQGGVTGFQGVLGALDNVMSSMGAQNKKAFESHKALATAQALISTYQAAAQSLALPPGPPFSFIYVAAAVAAGMAQVAAIQSQSYSGKAVGGSVMGNTPYIVGEKGPELFTPASSGVITPNDKMGGGAPVNINFNIQANDAQGFDTLLVQRRSMITQMVKDAMAEQGQRSRM